MQIGVLRVSFVLPGCRSLKEKRQRLGGLRERYGRQVNVAVCESNFQDIHDRAEWTFVAVGADLAADRTDSCRTSNSASSKPSMRRSPASCAKSSESSEL